MTATPATASPIRTAGAALADVPTVLLVRTVTAAAIKLNEAVADELAETFAAVLAKIFAAEQAILFTTIAVWAIKLS